MKKHFTLEELEEIYQFVDKRIMASVERKNLFEVKDGYVLSGDKVWWHSSSGPEYVHVESCHRKKKIS